jgi:beta-lactamase superfamily II metal-dependent hydrolase
MRDLYVADVAEGLCMALYTIAEKTIQIDCGSRGRSDVAFDGWERILHFLDRPYAFILSHFHLDHYNGLLRASINLNYHPIFRIRKVYYPGIPEFREKKEFMDAIFAMNMRVFGSETGVMECDFLDAIRKINRVEFRYKPLFKGDIVNINGSAFEVLWPPRILKEDNTLAAVRKALKDFERALEEDEEMTESYEKVTGIFERIQEEGIYPPEGYERKRRNIETKEAGRRELPEVVEEANKSIRRAANHLCLALFEDNRFLFLGDAEKSEIKQIVRELQSKSRTRFYVLITPHHGTNWHDSLRKIHPVFSITSNGSKSCSKTMLNFKNISRKSFATCCNGDIHLPIFSARLW